MLNFVLLSQKRWFQFHSKIVRTHFASAMTLNNCEIIEETQSYIFRWRSRLRQRRLCLSSLMKISRGRLTGLGKKLHQKACRTCSTIIFPHSTNQIIYCGVVVVVVIPFVGAKAPYWTFWISFWDEKTEDLNILPFQRTSLKITIQGFHFSNSVVFVHDKIVVILARVKGNVLVSKETSQHCIIHSNMWRVRVRSARRRTCSSRTREILSSLFPIRQDAGCSDIFASVWNDFSLPLLTLLWFRFPFSSSSWSWPFPL